MAGRRLSYQDAARLIVDADPLTEIRITLGWDTSGGNKLPLLRLSSRSVVDYKARAKPLGTLFRGSSTDHAGMLIGVGTAVWAEVEAQDQAASK